MLRNQDELETTTETLTLLAKNPNSIDLRALKPFKTAVYYSRVAHETINTGACILSIRNLTFLLFFTTSLQEILATSRISSALADQRYVDGLVFLAEMVIRE